MSQWYILNEQGEPVQVDMLDGAQWMQTHAMERIVARTAVVDGVVVSTAFLCLDHSFIEQGPPLLYETLVFGGVLDSVCNRYATRVEALEGHVHIVRLAHKAETEWRAEG